MRNSKGQNAALRTRLLTCGATAAIATACAFAVPVMAQDTAAAPAPAEDTTTIVVTGIRRGIQDAISAKKKSSQIVEAVSAEDIGKLPDASIAESIARLPGIAAQRTNGRAQTLSIRGLGPDFTLTTLNGREQVSTNDNRSVEFDQYPSELISQVVVYPKAGVNDAELAAQIERDVDTVQTLTGAEFDAQVGVLLQHLGQARPKHRVHDQVGGGDPAHDLDAYTQLLERDGTLTLVGAPATPHPSPGIMNLIFKRRSLAA